MRRGEEEGDGDESDGDNAYEDMNDALYDDDDQKRPFGRQLRLDAPYYDEDDDDDEELGRGYAFDDDENGIFRRGNRGGEEEGNYDDDAYLYDTAGYLSHPPGSPEDIVPEEE